MTEPTATIALSEYERLLRIAQSREAGLIEVSVSGWRHHRTYFVPEGVASRAVRDEIVRLQELLIQKDDLVSRFVSYARLPWYKRLFVKPPKATK